jgi:hypothetical protein
MNLENVIFIGGSGRCGTTLLAELLDLHPSIASIFEIHSFVFLLKCLKRNRVPELKALKKQHEVIRQALLPSTEYNWRITGEEALYAWEKLLVEPLQQGETLKNAIRKWVDFIHKLQIIRDGSQYIVHKTPILTMFLPEIKRLFPDSLFIHITRQPQDVILSYVQQDWGPTNLEEGINWYCQRVGAFLKSKKRFKKCLEVRFEDLISSPTPVLDEIQKTANIENQTQTILSYGLIDTKKINNRKSLITQREYKYISEQIQKRLPELSNSYCKWL